MRKPRDYDAELRALDDKARQLKQRKVQQLGEVVIATGADALNLEELAGALLAARDADEATRRAWRASGARLFRGTGGASARGARASGKGDAAVSRAAQPADAATSAS